LPLSALFPRNPRDPREAVEVAVAVTVAVALARRIEAMT
jgi:hypothetical protein